MAYASTRTFNLTIDEIIEEAFERCGLEVLGGYDLKTARRSLNLMFSEWANRGLNLWTIDYAYLDMVAAQVHYALDQKVVDVLDAVITTTTTASEELQGSSLTTDVAITKISRTEYMNLSRKVQSSAGDARPTQFTVINGALTATTPTKSYGRPEHDLSLWVFPSPDKAYKLKYFYVNRIRDAGAYSNYADVPFYFLPCLIAGLAYYISIKRAPMLSANLKSVYDEEFERTADANRERVSFRVKPAQAYIP